MAVCSFKFVVHTPIYQSDIMYQLVSLNIHITLPLHNSVSITAGKWVVFINWNILMENTVWLGNFNYV